jgi:TolB-like protein/DNA-binding winged helix-turn-helix (wHTH) protein/Flp pilus assembly protein TadD
MATSPPPIVRFSTFELDLRAGELRRAGVRVKLQDKPFRLLAALLERPGEVVTREELFRRLWPSDTFVDFDNGLNNAVNRVRAALGDAADRPRFVETVGRNGYRFIAPVDSGPPTVPAAEVPGAAPRHTSNRWAIAGAAVVVLVALAVAATRDGRREEPAAPIRSLAVLPFDTLSDARDDEYLADGITDALITELAGIRSLRVISRQSVIRYKGSEKGLPDIARELGVDALVEGTVLRGGDRLRVTAQLVHGPGDRHLWARSFESSAGDMLALQADIARAVAAGVRATLTAPEQARLARAEDVDPEAYDLYLRGRYFFNRRWLGDMEGSLRKCVDYVGRAVEKDPRFALAHATLAFCHVPLANLGLAPPAEAVRPIEQHARRALELDPDLSDGRLGLASAFFLRFDWAAAEAEYRKAVESNPASPQVRLWYSYFLLVVGRFEESLAQSAEGLRIDPFHPLLLGNHVVALADLGRGGEAIERGRQMVEIEPATRELLGRVYLRLGRESEALAEFERAGFEEGVARVKALRGDPSAMRARLGRLRERAGEQYVSPVDFAVLHAALGETDEAFARLEEGYRTRAPRLKELKTSWDLAPLRPDPRWRDLVQRLKL